MKLLSHGDDESRKYESMEKEYEMLKAEIESNSADLLKIASFGLPLAVAALGFAVENDIFWIAAAVFVFAATMINNQINYRKSTFRNATYCEVFLEPKLNRDWESRLQRIERNEYTEQKTKGLKYILKKRRPKFFEWVIIEGVSAFLFFSIQDGEVLEILLKPLNLIMAIIFIVVFILSIFDIFDISDVPRQKDVERDRWRRIKNEGPKEEQSNEKQEIDSEEKISRNNNLYAIVSILIAITTLVAVILTYQVTKNILAILQMI